MWGMCLSSGQVAAASRAGSSCVQALDNHFLVYTTMLFPFCAAACKNTLAAKAINNCKDKDRCAVYGAGSDIKCRAHPAARLTAGVTAVGWLDVQQ